MKRLTERDEFGNADIVGVDSADLQMHLEFRSMVKVMQALNRLAAYEDLGVTPGQVREMDRLYAELAKETGKLRERERAKKPIVWTDEWADSSCEYACPACFNFLATKYDADNGGRYRKNYCPRRGQRIDWDKAESGGRQHEKF